MSSLVIVESPAKAKTINKYLGKDYVVKSSIGHIRDLPVNARQVVKTGEKISTFDRMGIYPDRGWEANYQVLPGKEKVVSELRRLAKKSDAVYLATDLDREGEAIAWHLKELLEDNNQDFRRVIFNEITKSAITKAFANSGRVDHKRVEAQQTRRFLDRLVGFMVSPVLWQKVARGLSAGRVQSVALKLIVEREREIQQFLPQEYWRIFTNLQLHNQLLRFELTKFRGKKFTCPNAAEAQTHRQALEAGKYVLTSREVKPATSHPLPPFITSTLQQAASSVLGFGVKRTMMAAQRLYESGWITYMRTDSTSISQDALHSVREHIGQDYGQPYLPEKPNFYASRANAQEAHEAIRPTRADAASCDMPGDQARLYQLIHKRFVASQMSNARYENTSLKIVLGDYQLEAKGRVLLFDGFTKLLGRPQDKDVAELPVCKEGDNFSLTDVITDQHFTAPPARYSEASLVKELERCGIGRPSTYAAIISTIQDRGYVRMAGKRLHAEKIGEIVTDLLNQSFDDLMDYTFTAQMEEKLDRIANGELDWKTLLDGFYSDLNTRIETSGHTGRANAPVPTSLDCTMCGRTMLIRFGKNGPFLGCIGYAEKGEAKCSRTVNLIDVSDLPGDEDEDLSKMLLQRKRCPKCNLSMTPCQIDAQHRLHICGNSPSCSGNLLEEGEFAIANANLSEHRCHKCDSPLELKSGRFGKFFTCSNAACGATRGMLANGKPAPPKMTPVPMPELKCAKADDHFVLRDGQSGLFLAASSFPKHRETRPVKIAELLPHKDELDPKYHFLLSGPTIDDEGRPTTVRFSRKNTELYIGSETPQGRASTWGSHYKNGKWS